MNDARAFHTATLLANGTVLLVQIYRFLRSLGQCRRRYLIPAAWLAHVDTSEIRGLRVAIGMNQTVPLER